MLTGRTPMQLGAGETLPAAEVTLEKVLGPAGYACQTAAGNAGSQFLESQTPGKPFFLTVNFTGLQSPYAGVPQKQIDLYAQARLDAFSKEQPSPQARAGKEMLANLTGQPEESRGRHQRAGCRGPGGPFQAGRAQAGGRDPGGVRFDLRLAAWTPRTLGCRNGIRSAQYV